MRHLFILFFLLLFQPLWSSPYGTNIEKLLNRLDSIIGCKDAFLKIKEQKIEQLRMQSFHVHTDEERYWVNKRFYDEYFVYNADSAMVYANTNLEISNRLNRKDWLAEWRIKKSFLLSATGLLKEAQDVLYGIDGKQLSHDLQIEYYGQMMYLYSHLGQYSRHDMGSFSQGYYETESIYTDSIYAALIPEDPYYLWYKGWKFLGADGEREVIRELKEVVDDSPMESRREAMDAYILARLCREEGLSEDYVKYLIYSAMADVRTVNRDIASLEELAKSLFEMGDIDHSYIYINYCLQNAQLYRNRVRVIGISEVQNAIHKAYQERNRKQEVYLRTCLTVVSILSVILLIAVFFIYKQLRNQARSRHQLNEANELLDKRIDELSQAHTQLTEMNVELESVNEQLKSVNLQLKEAIIQLRESNYVKEEYIGYVFSICSNYISKLDEFRKTINRKLKAKQIDEVKTLTDTPTLAQNELKEFYHSFDAIFLHVYPDFVGDFNALLQPEERIVLKEGELLNTELRIYALVRLGINDSVKIAEFLHCSPQTVYNYRLRTRNKAIIPKDEFVKTIRLLGKMQE